MPLSHGCPVGDDIDRAAALLRAGRLVAFGTETVYGLGAAADNVAALARVFAVKKRPKFDPLIVHLADRAQLPEVAANIPPLARTLAERFWPGPLTLVLPKREAVPDLVTAGRPTVAVRVPGAEKTRALLQAAGLPIAAPSANPFGRISPTRAEHVAEQLGGEIDYLLDCGPCAVGIESTILDLTESPPRLLRPGGIALETLEQAIGPVGPPPPSSDGPQRAPGQLPKHYAPRTPLRLLEQPSATGPRCGLLTLKMPRDHSQFQQVEILSKSGDLVEAAAGFFAALRRLDAVGLDEIVAAPFPETGLGRALNDRLRRAAAGSAAE